MDGITDRQIAAIRETIGANLTALAALKGHCPNSLHLLTRLPKNNVYRAMRGSREPALHTLIVLAAALHVGLDQVLGKRPEALLAEIAGPGVSKRARTIKRKKKT
jgi:hypothetical protein